MHIFRLLKLRELHFCWKNVDLTTYLHVHLNMKPYRNMNPYMNMSPYMLTEVFRETKFPQSHFSHVVTGDLKCMCQ